ncbi:hypothetical protein K458DRAFT_29966 [Lentithecium fluviatile CBS 122367]|uniref:Uncharacterized protein n=1 Tax=Lentithecium fluviatile CBS 122367 TaxID=1168545 RepID=A0A6G1J1A2_9PLEO|nr:hypothetical protein K458DRAFT_29966 [Lentithecium fluviatile CBS 122367]
MHQPHSHTPLSRAWSNAWHCSMFLHHRRPCHGQPWNTHETNFLHTRFRLTQLAYVALVPWLMEFTTRMPSGKVWISMSSATQSDV